MINFNRSAYRLLPLLFLFAVIPFRAGSTGSGSPAFYIATDRSFSSSEQPYINLEGPGGGYDFRIYRVTGPARYLQSRIQDRLVQEKTPDAFADPVAIFTGAINRFTDDFRTIARKEFSAKTRTHLRKAAGVSESPVHEERSPAIPDLLSGHEFLFSFATPQEETGWSYRRIPIPLPERGLFLVEAIRGKHTAHTLVNRTQIAFAVKQGEEKTVVLVADRITGEPVEGASVSLLDESQKSASGSGVTDSTGSAILTGKTPSRSLVIVQKGDEYALSDPEFYSGSFYGKGGTRAYLYTDRPVYKPGEKLRFKAFVRNYRGSYAPASGTVKAFAISASGRKASNETSLSLSGDTGSATGELQLEEGKSPTTGLHNLVIDYNGKTFSTDFYVESYKRPPFRLQASPARSGYTVGESVAFTLQANYFSGGPVSGERINYRVTRRPLYFASPVGRLHFDAAADYLGLDKIAAYREPVLESSGTLNDRGQLTVTLPTKKLSEDSVYAISASVHTGSVVVSGGGSVPVYRAPFHIQVRQENRIEKPGEDFFLNLGLISYDANLPPEEKTALLSNNAIHLAVYRKSFISISSENERKLVYETSTKTDKKGEAKLPVKIADAGHYLARITAREGSGSETESTLEFWISGKSSHMADIPGNLFVQPGQDLYHPGDVAEILIASPVSDGTIFITLEGEIVHKTETVRMQGRSHLYKVRIDPSLTPGFTLGVVQFSGNRSYRGEAKIQAPPVDKFLQVEASPVKARYAPGEFAEINIKTLNAKGQGVPAELSVAVVDEAVYAIRSDETPDPGVFFYHSRRNNIATTLSSSYRFFGYSESRRMNLARNDSDILAGLKGETPEVREFFPRTAYWNGSLKTDSSGKTKVRFKTPDATTTWRVVVRAVSGDTKAGQTKTSFETWKELEAKAVFASAYYRGMEFPVALSIRNRTKQSQNVQVRLESEILPDLQEKEERLKIEAGQTGVVSFPIRLPENLTLQDIPIQFMVKSDSLSDSIKGMLPIRAFGIRKTEIKSFYLEENDDSFEAELEIPAKATDPELVLRMSPGGSEALREALYYLADYPYGCVEQTMSRFLPLLALRKSSLADLALRARLPRMIQIGIGRLEELQNPDGSFGWFGEQEEGDVLMSAYVYEGLVIALEQGESMQETKLQALRRYLYRRLADANLSPDYRAYLLQTLSHGGPVESSLLQSMVRFKDTMSARGLALAARTLLREGDLSQGRSLFELSYKKMNFDRHPRLFTAGLSQSNWENDEVETTADLLQAALILEDEEKIRNLSMNLLFNRRGVAWKSSRDTSAAVLALAGVVEKQNRNFGPAQVRLETNGESLGLFQYLADDPKSAVHHITGKKLLAGNGKFRLKKSEGQPLNGNLALSFFSEQKGFSPADSGIRTRRSYAKMKLSENRDGQKTFAVNETDRFQAGDLVLVTVEFEMSGRGESYFLIEDPIPQGFLFESEDSEYYSSDRTIEYVSRDVYEDRAVFFVRGPVQQGKIHYFLRAAIPGTSRVLPAKSSLMYYPDIQGTSKDHTLEVKP